MRLRRLAGIIVCCAVAGTMWPNSAQGTDVAPGHDLFTSGAGAHVDFGGSALPADFFGPGSDPLADDVPLEGSPLGTYDGRSVGDADTIVRRENAAVFLEYPGSATINIELVALSLKSVNPVTVTYNGGQDPELWDLEVTVSPTTASVGTMDIHHGAAEGGTYDATMVVLPRFTFTRVGDPADVEEIDAAEFGYSAPMSTTNSPSWEHDPVRGQLVVPGLTGPNFYIYGETRHDGPHPKVESTKTAQIPTLPEWGLAALTLLVLTAATVVFGRRRRAAA